VTALCEAGFIDEHPVHRYIVHDWQEHAPRWVTSKLSRAKESFCASHNPSEETTPQSVKPDSSEKDTGDSSGDYSPDSSADSKPSLAKSSQAKPSQGKKTAGSDETGTKKKPNYPEEFERAWKAYPKRNGGNPKRSAHHAWAARVKAGADPEVIIAGVERYARWADATGKTNTEFVKRAVAFFGPDEHYLEDWSPPNGGGGGAPGQSHAGKHTGFADQEFTQHLPDWATQEGP